MIVTLENPTKQDVIRALAELRSGRSRSRANICVRAILRNFGDGTRNVHLLDPVYYKAVFDAVGGYVISPEDFYGTVTDVPNTQIAADGSRHPSPAAAVAPGNRPTLRLKSPLSLDLERRLAERTGKPCSRPTLHVDTGNASRPNDEADDAPQPEYPAGERVS